jgi:hypothetical protein
MVRVIWPGYGGFLQVVSKQVSEYNNIFQVVN